MSFEQKRKAERLPLEEPLEASVGGTAAKIVELSAIGCRVEHTEKISIGGSTTLRFAWQGRAINVRAKVARTQLRSAYPQGMFYETGLKFAEDLESAPEQLRDLLASIAEPAVPPPVADMVITAEVPEIPEPPPSTPGEDTLRRIRLETERESNLPLEAFAPVEPLPQYDFSEAPPVVAPDPLISGIANPFATPAEAVALAVQPPEPEPEPEREYVECRLENGEWVRRVVTSLLQPPEGFITLPAPEGELKMLCKSYEYADPETRRLIRISLELAATQDTA